MTKLAVAEGSFGGLGTLGAAVTVAALEASVAETDVDASGALEASVAVDASGALEASVGVAERDVDGSGGLSSP